MRTILLAVLLFAVAAPSGALAQEEETSGSTISFGPMMGAGFVLTDTRGDVNSLGFGVGAHAGFHMLEPLFIGGQFVYFVGGSSDEPSGEISMHEIFVAAELGWEFDADPFILRPGLALGLSFRVVDAPPDFANPAGAGNFLGEDDDSADLIIAPGGSVVYPLQFGLDELYLAGNVWLPITTRGEADVGLTLLAEIGIRF